MELIMVTLQDARPEQGSTGPLQCKHMCAVRVRCLICICTSFQSSRKGCDKRESSRHYFENAVFQIPACAFAKPEQPPKGNIHDIMCSIILSLFPRIRACFGHSLGCAHSHLVSQFLRCITNTVYVSTERNLSLVGVPDLL